MKEKEEDFDDDDYSSTKGADWTKGTLEHTKSREGGRRRRRTSTTTTSSSIKHICRCFPAQAHGQHALSCLVPALRFVFSWRTALPASQLCWYQFIWRKLICSNVRMAV